MAFPRWMPQLCLVIGLAAVVFMARAGSTGIVHSTVSASATVHAASVSSVVKDPDSYEALVFRPQEGPGENLPLLLYLHGAGEMHGSLHEIISEGATGTPPVELTYARAPKILSRFVVVAPHTAEGWSVQRVVKFLDFLLRSDLDLDPARLYVTGHSMGGAGALLAATSRRFAAVVPVAASAAPPAEKLRGVPIWAFHGKNDVIVPSYITSELIQALWRNGASQEDVKVTLYDNAPAPHGWPDYFGHASTIPAYAETDLYEWLLQQQLPAGQL
ncbi:unnamed protein product [Symbiodinium sp. CCMP2592]|nr:unnamed protein product [Symbiodinium sp. CCMP2592]